MKHLVYQLSIKMPHHYETPCGISFCWWLCHCYTRVNTLLWTFLAYFRVRVHNVRAHEYMQISEYTLSDTPALAYTLQLLSSSGATSTNLYGHAYTWYFSPAQLVTISCHRVVSTEPHLTLFPSSFPSVYSCSSYSLHSHKNPHDTLNILLRIHMILWTFF